MIIFWTGSNELEGLAYITDTSTEAISNAEMTYIAATQIAFVPKISNTKLTYTVQVLATPNSQSLFYIIALWPYTNIASCGKISKVCTILNKTSFLLLELKSSFYI